MANQLKLWDTVEGAVISAHAEDSARVETVCVSERSHSPLTQAHADSIVISRRWKELNA